jgi:hypothetical protein
MIIINQDILYQFEALAAYFKSKAVAGLQLSNEQKHIFSRLAP